MRASLYERYHSKRTVRSRSAISPSQDPWRYSPESFLTIPISLFSHQP